MTTDERLLKLEGQVQALAQAWLHLASASETGGGHGLNGLSNALSKQRWPDTAFEPYAQAMLSGLVEQLELAQRHRSLEH
ncbi:hypothetical protein [Marinobacterium stanieri]|uniref:Uncharacterized protein n=1 Tax=Marinobacterium stanieri TaxID=49186 RepID=A0A1N6RNP4_9GAMM|nr:hypothetical protein [Marinobacterium stanieri]SIQ30397.1 hypothetical protein SAMN05421647_103435 [Marinobacterium stanieri]